MVSNRAHSKDSIQARDIRLISHSLFLLYYVISDSTHCIKFGSDKITRNEMIICFKEKMHASFFITDLLQTLLQREREGGEGERKRERERERESASCYHIIIS